jgi:16S rRNA processing protein RimM
MSVDLSEWLEIGQIVAAQGLKGEVRVYPDSDFPERFVEPGERWLLRPGSTQLELLQLQTGRFLEGKGLYVLRFAEIENREQAEQLRGSKLVVPVDDRPPLAAGEFHVMDLVGMTVIHSETQTLIGTVIGVAAAGNDLLEIELARSPQKVILVPLVPAFVTSLDLAARQLILSPIPGLIPDL